MANLGGGKKRREFLLLFAVVLVGALLLNSVLPVAGQEPGHGKLLAEARQALEEHLRSRPGFVGIAHSEERGGIVVFVENEEAEGIVSSRFEGWPVRIEVTGRIEALSAGVAEPLVRGHASQVSTGRTKRVRPLVGGISVSAYVAREFWAGTLGMVTYDNRILSNAHVIAMDWDYNFLPVGTPILQPGSLDGGWQWDEVGELEAYIPIEFGPDAENYADAAVGSIGDGVAVSPGEQFDEGGNYWVEGWTEVSEEDIVRKSGRTTGVTTGEVVSTNAVVEVSYGGQSAYFVDQIVVRGSFSQPGDSGSLVDKDGRFVGLVFAGNDEYSIVCKAQHIIAGLGIAVETSLGIVTSQLPAGRVGVPYEATLEAIGGTHPYTWAIIDGALPDGLGIGEGTGVIAGTPTEASIFNFRVEVTDNDKARATRDLSISIVIIYDLTISSAAGGAVTVPGEGVFPYEGGTAVDLVAEAEEGYEFVRWTGDVDTVGDVDAAETTITMNSDKSVTADFQMENLCEVWFTADKTEVEVGETVTFTNETTGGTPPYLAAEWDFDGDGITDSTDAAQPGDTVTRVYGEPGLYTISLTITTTHETCTQTRHDHVKVYVEPLSHEPSPEAGFESIADHLVIAYHYAGFGVWDVYWPELGIDTIQRLEEGKIYILYVNSDCTLQYGSQSYELSGPDWNFIYWLPQ